MRLLPSASKYLASHRPLLLCQFTPQYFDVISVGARDGSGATTAERSRRRATGFGARRADAGGAQAGPGVLWAARFFVPRDAGLARPPEPWNGKPERTKKAVSEHTAIQIDSRA